MTRSMLRRVVAASLATLSAAAFAQVQPTLTVAFDSGSVVPVGSAATVGAGLLLAFVAFWVLRKRGAAARSLLGLAAAALVVAGGLTATDTSAISSTQVNLVTSPTTVNLSGGFYNVTNVTGGQVVIRAITLQNAPGYAINTTQTTCTAGLSLASGASCTVLVSSNMAN
ncbi:MAG: hypothetical protein JNL19_07645 [Burkholderiales bacterium]|nr:hypothetical protein [Burkholderiales bacterium]